MSTPIEKEQPLFKRFQVLRDLFLSQLFRTILINLSLNILVWGGFIAMLPFFGNEMEQLLFPSVKQIQKIRTEINHIHLIQDEKGKEINALSSKTQHEIANLKNTVHKLSEEIKVLHDRLSTPLATLAVPQPNEIAIQWNSLLKNFEKGEPFEAQLHSFDPFVKDHKDILFAIHDLVNVASKRTTPFDKLASELTRIKEQITNQSHTNDTHNSSFSKHPWLNAIWEKIKSHISFEKIAPEAIDLKDPSKKAHIIKAIDEAISSIQAHKYADAIKIIKANASSAKPAFDQWLVDADTRLSIEIKIEILRQHLAPFLTSKVN